jgi:hypothetical protein
MTLKKKVTWNPGQVPERNSRPRLPPYVAEPEVKDESLREAWNQAHVGQMCLALNSMFARHTSRDSLYPHPMMYGGEGGWGGEVNAMPGQAMVYLGHTHVECLGSKGKIIKRPYMTVFFNGMKFLIADPNNLKPLE